jgi:hypothetical protein
MRIYKPFNVVAVAVVLCALVSVPAGAAGPVVDGTSPARQKVASVEFLGDVTFPAGLQFEGADVGALSGLAYDPDNETYYALAGDPGPDGAARFYALTIDLSDGKLDEGDVQVTGAFTLTDSAGQPYSPEKLGPSGIAVDRSGQLYVCSGDDPTAMPPIEPFVGQFTLEGQQVQSLPIPPHFTRVMSDTTPIAGIRRDRKSVV